MNNNKYFDKYELFVIKLFVIKLFVIIHIY
jgi:hypothetical protein